jgi:hypothetical protein
VVAAVVPEHEAGDGQPFSVIERQIAIDRVAPPPIAQGKGMGSPALDAEFNARGMSTFVVDRRKSGP